MIKIIFASLGSFLLLVLGYLVFMYFFFSPPGPIQEYEFPKMTYSELEVKVSKITSNKLNSKFNLTEEELLNKRNSSTRAIILGKDSLQFYFITNMDEGYKFKTKKRHPEVSLPWLELISICDSKGKYIGVFRKNRDEHPELIQLFEDEFIKKINNGKVNVIERNLWENIKIGF